MKPRTSTTTGHALALFTCFIWGTTFISTKILLQSFTPIEILFIRFALGFLALCIAYPRHMPLIQKQHIGYFIGAGISGVTLYFLCENIALTYTEASNVSVIVAICPFFTALLSRWFLKTEKLSAQFFVGFICSMIGITLISIQGGAMRVNFIGDALALLAAIVWAVYSILTRKISGFGYQTVPATRLIFGFGLLFMIPALFLLDFSPSLAMVLQPLNLCNLLYLGLGASAACFATWNVAQRILGAVRTSVYIYCVPVIGVVFSAIILREHITWQITCGIMLTLCGLFLSEHKLHFGLSRKKFQKDL